MASYNVISCINFNTKFFSKSYFLGLELDIFEMAKRLGTEWKELELIQAQSMHKKSRI